MSYSQWSEVDEFEQEKEKEKQQQKIILINLCSSVEWSAYTVFCTFVAL